MSATGHNMSATTQPQIRKIIIRIPVAAQKQKHTRLRQTRTPERVKELVNVFASIHCNEDRKIFKTEWNQWIHSGEIDSLMSELYPLENDREEMEKKLFISARYYHRKKIIKNVEKREINVQVEEITSPLTDSSNEVEVEVEVEHQENKTKETRAYNKNDRAILKLIDDHLASLPNDQLGFLVKPSAAFAEFVRLYGHNEKKKTYKNRFYMKEKQLSRR